MPVLDPYYNGTRRYAVHEWLASSFDIATDAFDSQRLEVHTHILVVTFVRLTSLVASWSSG